MPHAGLTAAVDCLRSAARRPEDDLGDGQLVGAFVARQDQGAFAALVRRHGPMVLGVCRRLLGDAHEADDAFQATFLVLARRAGSVSPREAVGAFLHGVAVRTALGARKMAARRRARVVTVAEVPECPAPQAEPADALAALDEEVARLPQKYRAVVVPCELEGEPRRDVARRLGVPEGTVSSRLAQARKLLAARLRRRGVALPAASLAALLARSAPAAVPAALVAAVARLAEDPGCVSANVAALSSGALRSMFLAKLKSVALGCLLFAAALACAGGHLGSAALVAGAPVKGAAEKPRPARPGKLLLMRADGAVVLTPEGKELARLPAGLRRDEAGLGWLSPDGTRVASLIDEGGRRKPRARVVVRKLSTPKAATVFDVETRHLCWSPDGKRLLAVHVTGEKPEDLQFQHVLVDAQTGETEELPMPPGVAALDWSADGKAFVVLGFDAKGRPWLGLLRRGAKEARRLTELQRGTEPLARLSPDGKKVLFLEADPDMKDAHKWGLSGRPHVLDVATGKRRPLAEVPLNAQVIGLAWSPDGKRVAYTWRQLHLDLLKKDTVSADEMAVETEAFLIVADADGKNPKTIASAKGHSALRMILGAVDWR
jgi:RNA polymerase sigma factor (sigma-70 family)